MKIICPKCGEVNMFRTTEYLRRQLFIDNKGEGAGSTEDECIRSGKPRCVKCGRLVKLVDTEGEKRKNLEKELLEAWNRRAYNDCSGDL